MPASYVHQSIASAALRQIGKTLEEQCLAAFLAGCEGPDPLFYGFYRGKPGIASASGIRMHRERTETFLSALLASAATGVEQSYCLGFLTHYAGDTVFHPYVYGHSLMPDGSYSSNLHGIVEHAYEIVRYRRDGNPSGVPAQLKGLRLLSSGSLSACTGLFASAMKMTYPDQFLDAPTLSDVFTAGVHVADFLYSASGLKYHLLGRMPFGLNQTAHAHMIPPEIPETDLWNDAHLPWASIFEPNRIRTESMDDLYPMAVNRAAELLLAANRVFNNSLSLPAMEALLGGLSYDSGLPWRETPSPDKAPGCKPQAKSANI